MLDQANNEERFRLLRAATGREIVVDQERFLFFGGTAYLGLTKHPIFLDLYIKGLQEYGINNGTSRSNNVQLGIYEEAEQFAANYFDSASALVLSSGFLAAQLVVKHFSAYGEVIYAPNAHPALWISDKPDQSLEFSEWMTKTVNHINRSKEKRFLIISNALDALKPQQYDFSLLDTILPSKEIILIIDDSHGIGVVGEWGKGSQTYLPEKEFIKPIIVASMAKALGLDAGLILASQEIIQALRQNSLFLGASPPAPAAMYVFTKAASVFEDEYLKLQENIHFFERYSSVKLTSIKGLPVYYSEDQSLSERLKKENIVISSFRYPQPTDPILNRIVLTSGHTVEDLSRLIKVLNT